MRNALKQPSRARCLLGSALVLLVSLAVGATEARATETQVDIEATVVWLSSADWAGRGNDDPRLGELADSLVTRLGSFGRVQVQSFVNRAGLEQKNVVWLRPPRVEPESWVVLGAHYDHLGRGGPGDPHEGVVYPGADDNASGVATALAVVERLSRMTPGDRGIAVVLFAGEETGLEGSRAFVERGPIPSAAVAAMVNLDTVGRLGSGGLSVFGAESSPTWRPTLEGINSAYLTKLRFIDRSSGASDDASFVTAGIPSVHLFTGAHGDYHRPGDTADKVDVDGLDLLADFVTDLVDYLADSAVDLRFVPQGAEAAIADPKRATQGKRRVSFGSIPDFQFAGPGVRITGVLPGSPAQKAGLQDGDVILAFGGEAVADLTDYSEAMKLYSPGDEVAVRLRRGAEEMEVRVTLVERK